MVIARTRSRSLWIPLSYLQTSPKKIERTKHHPPTKNKGKTCFFHYLDVPFSSYQLYNANKTKTKVRKTHWKPHVLLLQVDMFIFFLAKRRFRRPGGCIQGGCSLGWTATCAAACGAWGARGAWGSGTWWPDEKSIRRRIGNPWFRCAFQMEYGCFISVQSSSCLKMWEWPSEQTLVVNAKEALCLSRLIK